MWQLIAPSEAVVSYDSRSTIPQNPYVGKVTVERVRELFPHGRLPATKVILVPPLARRVARMTPLYNLLNAVPILRSHNLVTIFRPA